MWPWKFAMYNGCLARTAAKTNFGLLFYICFATLMREEVRKSFGVVKRNVSLVFMDGSTVTDGQIERAPWAYFISGCVCFRSPFVHNISHAKHSRVKTQNGTKNIYENDLLFFFACAITRATLLFWCIRNGSLDFRCVGMWFWKYRRTSRLLAFFCSPKNFGFCSIVWNDWLNAIGSIHDQLDIGGPTSNYPLCLLIFQVEQTSSR